jgi:ferritin
MEIRKFGAQGQAQAQPQVQAQPQNQESNLPMVNTNNGPITPNSLTENIINMFNERLGDEYTAYYFYRNAANWCKNVNFKKAAGFFESEASGELEHALGIQDYLTQWNIIPTIPQAPTTQSFQSLVDIINKAYNLEYNLLLKYSENQQSLASEHPATFNFIQKYVDIQNGEVSEYSDLLNAAILVDTNDKFQTLYFEQTYF